MSGRGCYASRVTKRSTTFGIERRQRTGIDLGKWRLSAIRLAGDGDTDYYVDDSVAAIRVYGLRHCRKLDLGRRPVRPDSQEFRGSECKQTPPERGNGRRGRRFWRLISTRLGKPSSRCDPAAESGASIPPDLITGRLVGAYCSPLGPRNQTYPPARPRLATCFCARCYDCSSISCKRWRAALGSALPFVARMTWPMKKPNNLSSPPR